MNVLLLGSGGREHAFAWKIKQSQWVDKLWIAPGNTGTAELGINVKLDVLDFESVGRFALEHQISMIVVGPEEPLVHGIFDFFQQHAEFQGIKVIGPSAAGAQLEGSKDFAKQFMERHGIPTARYQTFTKASLYKGFQFLDELSAPYVLKADGLAAGKGVLILDHVDDAKRELAIMLSEDQPDAASKKVVIEEFMHGVECSVFILTDGKHYVLLPEAKDYKRIGERDTGLNTGGMGAISPVPFVDEAFLEKVTTRIIEPTLKGLQAEQIVYQGFIYIGLMNCQGNPFVVEYNCRMGDPETQVVLPRITTDLVPLFGALATGNLKDYTLEISPERAVTVVLASQGYPGTYIKDKVIHIQSRVADTHVFHAGIRPDGARLLTSGGRVLAVTGLAAQAQEALSKAYQQISEIQFEGMYCRKDIGADLWGR